MSRPTLEVADLIRAQGNPGCGHQAISYNSCRNRHCPKCQTQARQRWLAAREQEVLPTAYFHVVFSVPHELNVLALENPRCFYDLLFTAASATLLEVAANPKRLGAEVGVIAILHTWGQNLLLHPHIHCVVPAGGLAPDHTRWISAKSHFFLPAPVLRKVFRGKFIAGLKRLRQRGKLCRSGPAALLAEPKQFAKLLRRLHLRRWVVYAKAPFGEPMQVPRYLGRYTHRVATSNHRLVAFDGEHVSFQWKDYAHGGAQKIMTLAATEFLRRFFLHVLPKGFVRIRHFGFLANCFRTQALGQCRELLTATRHSGSRADCKLALSSLRGTNGSTAIVHSRRAAKAMSHARFLLATQNISDYTTGSAQALASVCLHAATIPPTHTESGLVAPAQLQKPPNLSGASSLPAKTRSAFERAVTVLSP